MPKNAPQKFENTHDKSDIWTGLEYEAACNMITSGLIDEALVIIKAIDNRYDGVKRNPWNEIEGSDHYSRSMHSWNILRCLSGLYHNGPKGVLSFNPVITPENYKALFTAAGAWGSYSQKIENKEVEYVIEVKHGELNLCNLSLPILSDKQKYEISLNGNKVDANQKTYNNKLIFSMSNLKVEESNKLIIRTER